MIFRVGRLLCWLPLCIGNAHTYTRRHNSTKFALARVGLGASPALYVAPLTIISWELTTIPLPPRPNSALGDVHTPLSARAPSGVEESGGEPADHQRRQGLCRVACTALCRAVRHPIIVVWHHDVRCWGAVCG